MRNKKSLLLIVILILTVLLTGCGGENSAADDIKSGIDNAVGTIKNAVAGEKSDKVEEITPAVAESAEDGSDLADSDTEAADASEGLSINVDEKIVDISGPLIIDAVPETSLTDESVPEYTGEASIVLNNDTPDLNGAADEMQEGEILLSAIDDFGRAGTAMMLASPDMLPTGQRGPTGNYQPSGWNQNKYPGVVDSDPPYLYNRAHLLMWALSGLTDIKENLISGTRYMNIDGMLPIEDEVLNYVESSGESVVYRATPVYVGNNLLASGVIIEAASLSGAFQLCRYVYNVQPGVEIDYATGENHLTVESAEAKGEAEPTPEPLDVYAFDFILNTHTLKFHKPSCDSVTDMKEKNKDGFNGSAEELIERGYSPCHACCPEWVPTPEPTVEPTPETRAVGTDYVLNTNTRKFHRPGCRSVKTMKPKNTQYYSGTRDEVIAMGYDPCQNCNP